MKPITPYLIKFAITAAFLTIAFRYVLSYGIEHQNHNANIYSAVLYGSLMFVSGWIFGKKDNEYLPIFDIGFRFHLTAYLIHNGLSLSWVSLGLGAKDESLSIALMVAAYWGVFLVIHFIFYMIARKRTIDSLDKEDIFE